MARNKKIQYTHWTGFTGTFAGQAAGTAAVNLLAAQHEPETLLRTRGNLLSYGVTPQAPGVSAIITVGMILVPEGSGTTVTWSPLTDADAPWFWYEQFMIGYEEMVIDVVDVPGITSLRTVIDSKSMRIVRNQEIQLVMENTTIGGAISVLVNVQGRFLSGTG